MQPFDFVITFFSFIFSLALAHLLLAVGQMIRHRRELVFDWAHALWMSVALGTLTINWLSFWDGHTLGSLSMATIAIGLAFCINQYLVCALVSPRIPREDGVDMRAFHQQQGPTYIFAILVLCVFSIAVNLLGGSALDMTNWATQNAGVLAMLAVLIPALVWRARWVQVVSPAILIVLIGVFLVTYYPVLR
ncbi:MAG TPA: hypothetical protein VFO25_06625 [Candidatus Eremiobacteraceae bacterium]|nr:hypothetical protein [Candidatus Eremiobacteraceae bacterium]